MIFQIPPIFAQKFTNQEKSEVLIQLMEEIKKSYINESKAKEMADFIENKLWENKYDSILVPEEFAFILTQDLRLISHDLHLEVIYEREPLEDFSEEEEEQNWLTSLLEDNGYGIKNKMILEANIGYLAIPFFGPVKESADTLFKAMEYLKDTDALIIDLRECRGSLDGNMIPLFCGYFFNEPVHLFNFENRLKNSIRQFWSSAYVPGEKYLEKPIYILISGRTFSGGEEFAYDMKHLGRAILVGQVTKGGAQPKYPVRLSRDFIITIPMERSVNPVTGTNWEVVGVKPNVEVNAALSLHESQVLILEKLIEMETDEFKTVKLRMRLEELKKNPPLLRKISVSLAGYQAAKEVAISGSFNYWATHTDFLVKTENGWKGELELIPGDHHYKFIIDGRWILDPGNPHQVEVEGRMNSLMRVD